jgi:carbohydrate-binding DOMON domain-containing protein
MMATTEERMKILRMIEEGKLTAEEGAKLLSALSESRGRVSTSTGISRGTGSARWLRVKVTDMASGRSKATVQIPIGLLEAGMKIGAHFAPEVEGVDMSEIMDALRAGVTGKIVDVMDDEDGEHVEIYVE